MNKKQIELLEKTIVLKSKSEYAASESEGNEYGNIVFDGHCVDSSPFFEIEQKEDCL